MYTYYIALHIVLIFHILASYFTDQEASNIKNCLKYNFSNKDETIKRWHQTANYRLKEFLDCNDNNIKKIIEEWPAYKQCFGGELVIICEMYSAKVIC